MRKLPMYLLSVAVVLTAGLTLVRLTSPQQVAAQGTATVEACDDGTLPLHGKKENCFKCDDNGFLGLISWHHYLSKKGDCSIALGLVEHVDNGSQGCKSDGGCDIAQTSKLNSLWLIAIAVFEDLLRIAGVVAVVFIIYGGSRYITGDGQPENVKQAHATLINALIGLAVAMIGATLVAFIGNRLGGT